MSLRLREKLVDVEGKGNLAFADLHVSLLCVGCRLHSPCWDELFAREADPFTVDEELNAERLPKRQTHVATRGEADLARKVEDCVPLEDLCCQGEPILDSI